MHVVAGPNVCPRFYYLVFWANQLDSFLTEPGGGHSDDHCNEEQQGVCVQALMTADAVDQTYL